jgi:hypothetical protein
MQRYHPGVVNESDRLAMEPWKRRPVFDLNPASIEAGRKAQAEFKARQEAARKAESMGYERIER